MVARLTLDFLFQVDLLLGETLEIPRECFLLYKFWLQEILVFLRFLLAVKTPGGQEFDLKYQLLVNSRTRLIFSLVQ